MGQIHLQGVTGVCNSSALHYQIFTLRQCRAKVRSFPSITGRGGKRASHHCHWTCEELAEGPEAGQTLADCIPCTLLPSTAMSSSALHWCPFTRHEHQVSLLRSIEKQLFGSWIPTGPESNTVVFAIANCLSLGNWTTASLTNSPPKTMSSNGPKKPSKRKVLSVDLSVWNQSLH